MLWIFRSVTYYFCVGHERLVSFRNRRIQEGFGLKRGGQGGGGGGRVAFVFPERRSYSLFVQASWGCAQTGGSICRGFIHITFIFRVLCLQGRP